MQAKLAFLGLGAAACVGIGAVVATPGGSSAEQSQAAEGFDLDLSARTPDPVPAAAPAPQEASEPVPAFRDAISAGPLSVVPAARMLPPPPSVLAAVKASQPAAWAKRQGVFKNLLSHPASFMVKKTNLGSPAKLRSFIADKARVQRYLSHPLIKTVLASPTLVRLTVKSPGVAAAFLSSPAMQDRRTVQLLSKSGLLDAIMTSPGVAAVVKDPAFIAGLTSEPRTMKWLMANPQMLGFLTSLAAGKNGR